MDEEIEDEEIEVNEINAMRDQVPRVFRNRMDPFDIYSDSEFQQRYRLTKECARYVITLVERRLHPRHRRMHNTGSSSPYHPTLLCERMLPGRIR